MRTCMYCGRELGQGDKCDCPKSVARRGGTAQKDAQAGSNNTGSRKTGTSYKTGYAGNDSPFERAKNRYRARRAARSDKGYSAKNGFWSGIWRYIKTSLISPVEAVTNPTRLSKTAMLSIAAAMGALLWLCVFFVLAGGALGPIRMAAALMNFGDGYPLIARMGMVFLSGACSGIIMFFVYTGIFYLINRFVMRMRTNYWEFCIRLVSALVPFTVICLIGTLLSLLSPYTLAALVVCGAVTFVVLTYEALKTEWYSVPPSKVMTAMLLGYFVFFTIMGHFMMLR